MKKDFEHLTIEPIGDIHSDFDSKFGIPRQGDIVSSLKGVITFRGKYRKEGILRSLEGFSHLWLIWGFSDFEQSDTFSPTIRPPKLGGNERVGVFASRSPNRPNPIGMTACKIESIIQNSKEGPKIIVSGIDMMNNTPIYDIKPYIPFSDCIPDAKEGYTAFTRNKPLLNVIFDDSLKEKMDQESFSSLIEILKQDPRPGFQHDGERIYGFSYRRKEIKFKVIDDKTLILLSIEEKGE